MELNGEQISLVQLAAVALGAEPVHISSLARPRILASRKVIEQIVGRDVVVYGVNTGFGKLSDVRIPQNDLRQLQLNLVRSHACGIGNPLSEAEVRAMMVLRGNVLVLGLSGIRYEFIELLCELLNRRVCPVVPEKGSVGASGDLAPLAHLALTLIGEGEAFFEAQRMSGAEALRRAQLTPLQLEAKEGLALLNGTQGMHAVGGLALLRAQRVACVADVAGAMSLEALKGTPAAFDYAAIAIADLMSMSERRTDRLVNPDKSEGLPAFLARHPGLESGFMTAQVAAASLVNEARVLAHPASVDNITTSGGKEDHVSMGMTSALKLRSIVELAENLLAIELLAAAEGLEYRRPLKAGRGVERAFATLRKIALLLTGDRALSDDIARVAHAIRRGDFDLKSESL